MPSFPSFFNNDNHFFHGGHLIDVNTISSQMEFYLKENRSVFEKLSDEFKKELKELP